MLRSPQPLGQTPPSLQQSVPNNSHCDSIKCQGSSPFVKPYIFVIPHLSLACEIKLVFPAPPLPTWAGPPALEQRPRDAQVEVDSRALGDGETRMVGLLGILFSSTLRNPEQTTFFCITFLLFQTGFQRVPIGVKNQTLIQIHHLLGYDLTSLGLGFLICPMGLITISSLPR